MLFWTVTALWVLFGAMTIMVDAAPDALAKLYQLSWGA